MFKSYSTESCYTQPSNTDSLQKPLKLIVRKKQRNARGNFENIIKNAIFKQGVGKQRVQTQFTNFLNSKACLRLDYMSAKFPENEKVEKDKNGEDVDIQ